MHFPTAAICDVRGEERRLKIKFLENEDRLEAIIFLSLAVSIQFQFNPNDEQQ